jgi:hypothetical protein
MLRAAFKLIDDDSYTPHVAMGHIDEDPARHVVPLAYIGLIGDAARL